MQDPRPRIVAGASLVQFTIIGFLFAYGIFVKELETELGWSRTLLSLGPSLATFMMGVLAIFGGRLNDRFGPRRVLTISGVIFALGILLLAGVSQPWQYIVLFSSFLAIGLATHDVVTLSTVARWYDKRRGLMTGVVKVGTALGQAVMPPVAAALILWFGWRQGMVAFGVSSGVILLAGAMLMRLPGPGEGARGSGQGSSGGSIYSEARRTRTFWTICAIQFLFFPTLMTVPFHMALHGMDLGLAQNRAAFLLTVMGLASVVGRLAVGFFADQFSGRAAYTVALSCLTASLLMLAYVTNTSLLYAVVAFYGFAHGAHFVFVSPTVARYFGMRAHGAIFGTVLFFGTVGGAIGPTLAGWVFDSWGSYVPAFLVLAVASGLAALLAQTLPKAKD